MSDQFIFSATMTHILNIEVKEAIEIVSKNQNYQAKMLILTTLICIEVALSHLINSTVFTNPLFHCQGILTPQSTACANMDNCYIQNNFTATFHAELYCDNRLARMNIQSIYGIGVIVGLITFSIMNDSKGRKFTMALCLVFNSLAMAMLVISIYLKFYLLIFMGQFLSGASLSACMTNCYSLSFELFNAETFQTTLIIFNASWAIVDFIVFCIYELYPSWYIYLILAQLIPVLYLSYQFLFYVVETPQFILTKNKDIHQSFQSVRIIAILNQASPQDLLQAELKIKQAAFKFFSHQENEESSTQEVLCKVVRDWKIVKSVICLATIKFSYFLYYFGVLMCLERVGFDFGVTILVIGVGELVGYLLLPSVAPKMGKKTLLRGSNICKALLGLSFISQDIQDSKPISVLLFIIIFALSFFNYLTIIFLENDIFNTNIKSTLIGSVTTLSFTSRLLLPYIVGLINETRINPIIIFSFIFIVFQNIPAFFLEEPDQEEMKEGTEMEEKILSKHEK